MLTRESCRMKNNDFFPRIIRRKRTGIAAVCLFIIIIAGLGSAASRNGIIAEMENPCNGSRAPEHCIPPSYWMNAGTVTTPVEFQAPSPLWSDTIGEYQARVGISGDGRSVNCGIRYRNAPDVCPIGKKPHEREVTIVPG